MISHLRKTGHFSVFAPVNDLSALSKSSNLIKDAKPAAGEVIGDEWASQLVLVRDVFVLFLRRPLSLTLVLTFMIRIARELFSVQV